MFLSNVDIQQELSSYSAALAYQAELQTDMDTFELDIIYPRVYNAKFAKHGTEPDSPSFHQALSDLEAYSSTEICGNNVVIY